jgi:hypothetical protein
MRVENETIKKFTNVLLSMLLLLSDFIMGYIIYRENRLRNRCNRNGKHGILLVPTTDSELKWNIVLPDHRILQLRVIKTRFMYKRNFCTSKECLYEYMNLAY